MRRVTPVWLNATILARSASEGPEGDLRSRVSAGSETRAERGARDSRPDAAFEGDVGDALDRHDERRSPQVRRTAVRLSV